ncbi:hypothetical protein PMY56_00370 [Clostridium tertium]|jgi:hypothetical protein|uniref:hypothetical protein n=1 Tax=Clostridium TaxID=1485 RepID=UPI00163DC71A|nr:MULTISPECIES: hypothetical protein [Clostridium]MDB7267189.1 hypothetical protein [Enterococcus faecium]MBS5308025.1 hypothetical protein [Clostridium sp.]MDB1921344.1 hypothetical protein [Clostridium tertium]MDB1924589.1 hypothetical protein [Clostridium tertium]MDB1928118.1 hypothetical protein [Clostridium tertium]
MENETVKEKVDEVPKKNMRDTLYGNLDVSVKTMDRVIAVLFVLLALSLIIGALV